MLISNFKGQFMRNLNLNFLKKNERMMKLCLIAKLHLKNNDLDSYIQVKELIISLVIKEFGHTPILWPSIIVDKLIYDVNLPTEIDESSNTNITSNNNDVLEKDKDVITEADLYWW